MIIIFFATYLGMQEFFFKLLTARVSNKKINNNNFCFSYFKQQCSKSCGDGVQTRHVECMSMEDNSVETKKCAEENKPVAERSCFNAPCGSTWKISQWGEVSYHGYISYYILYCNLIKIFRDIHVTL